MVPQNSKMSLWQKWTICCASGELLGIGIAGGIAFLVNTYVGEPVSFSSKVIVLSMMMLAGFIEGYILAQFQWYALKDKFKKLPRKQWTFNTVLVAVLGWFLGMLPSLFFIHSGDSTTSNAASFDFENPFVFTTLCLSAGLLLGSIFGFFQWLVLRKYALHSHAWIIANATGWGLGMIWIYVCASLPNDETSLPLHILSGISGGLLAGLSVGAITGRTLIILKEK